MNTYLCQNCGAAYNSDDDFFCSKKCENSYLDSHGRLPLIGREIPIGQPEECNLERKMCHKCPFNPEVSYHKYHEDWANLCELIAKKQAFDEGLEFQQTPHGCHLLEDTYPCHSKNICIGHSNYLNRPGRNK